MERTLRDRFEALVDGNGAHYVWTGATRPDTGPGRLKVEGKHVAAHKVAWERVDDTHGRALRRWARCEFARMSHLVLVAETLA